MSAEFIIENNALIRCKQDELSETVTIPDGVEKIMTFAFLKCQCKEIIIPPSVKLIEYAANLAVHNWKKLRFHLQSKL